MKPEYPINSAMKALHLPPDDFEELEEVEFFGCERGVVFAHDMNKPYSKKELEVLAKAECVHSQLALSAGMKVFAERAGVKQHGSHKDYLISIRRLVERLNKPTYIVCNSTDIRHLVPERIAKTALYIYDDATLAIWGEAIPAEERINTVKLSVALASRYESVYDFSCGFGNTLRPFSFSVGSDIDKRCLGYVKNSILLANRE